jgi:hypothetical protein
VLRCVWEDDDATDETENLRAGMVTVFKRYFFLRCDQKICTLVLDGVGLAEAMPSNCSYGTSLFEVVLLPAFLIFITTLR